MEIESKVLVGLSKVEGVVKEIEETTGSVLVSHKVMVDGRSKDIKQWYDQNAVKEVVEKAEVIEEVEKKGKSSKKAKVELGILPETEKGDSDGK